MLTYELLVLTLLCAKVAWLLIQLLIGAWFHWRDRGAPILRFQIPRLPKRPQSGRPRGIKLEIRLELNW